jgi:hypothetical protein
MRGLQAWLAERYDAAVLASMAQQAWYPGKLFTRQR